MQPDRFGVGMLGLLDPPESLKNPAQQQTGLFRLAFRQDDFFEMLLRVLVPPLLETEPSELTEIRPGPQATSISVHLSGVAGTFVKLHEFVATGAGNAGDAGSLAEHHRRRADVLRRLEAMLPLSLRPAIPILFSG